MGKMKIELSTREGERGKENRTKHKALHPQAITAALLLLRKKEAPHDAAIYHLYPGFLVLSNSQQPQRKRRRKLRSTLGSF